MWVGGSYCERPLDSPSRIYEHGNLVNSLGRYNFVRKSACVQAGASKPVFGTIILSEFRVDEHVICMVGFRLWRHSRAHVVENVRTVISIQFQLFPSTFLHPNLDVL